VSGDRAIDPMMETEIRLTEYAHGGGCGCKIAPSLLSKMLAELPLGQQFPGLLVGTESGDDAAVYQLNESQALVATTDFFMPVVDDPYDFGRIAATNALSDVYAMGAKPILALAVVGMPVNKLPVETIRKILAGGESVCRLIGIPVAGGHSIDSPEPIYGLVAIGLTHPRSIKRNDRARAGDRLILGKPLGIGILSAALKKGQLNERDYKEMLATTTQLNTAGAALATLSDVHAMTDVTGFGLLGHLLGVCRGSKLAARVSWDALPILQSAARLAQSGFVTGASGRNWDSYGEAVAIPAQWPAWRKNLLTDPQTSGGLLVACDPSAASRVLEIFSKEEFALAREIGSLEAGAPRIIVE
jgi:selenide,water dikinase